MKKVICVILSFIMTFLCLTPAFAQDKGASVEAKDPVIYISGDSQPLYYDNDTKEFSMETLISIVSDGEDGSVAEALFNILYPFLVKGILFNDWNDYYDAVYKELSDSYAPVQLDKNGNPQGDCGVSKADKMLNERAKVTDLKSESGTYSEKAYFFNYDWRLDPIELADELNEYIEGVKTATGRSRVSITAKCLGCNVVLAYIDKYGSDSIKGIGFDASTSMGAEFLSGVLSGKFGLDGNSIARMGTDLTERSGNAVDIVRVVTAIVDLLDNTGILDGVNAVARKLIYSKIEYGIVSALALSTMMSFPCYWALVTTDDFDEALQYVFGAPGSEKREEYKGLIEKVTVYNNTIKSNVCSILKKASDNGVNMCIVAKYGTQMVPILKGGTTYIGDEYVSAARASFGATTGTVYSVLPDEYIANRIAEGKGKYISPDKQIDASTCLFPDYTWFVKCAPHGQYTNQESNLIMNVIDADRQLTVDDFEWTQFFGYHYQSGVAFPLTEENCNIEYWTADEKIDHPKTFKEKINSFIVTFKRLVKSIIGLLKTRVFKLGQ